MGSHSWFSILWYIVTHERGGGGIMRWAVRGIKVPTKIWKSSSLYIDDTGYRFYVLHSIFMDKTIRVRVTFIFTLSFSSSQCEMGSWELLGFDCCFAALHLAFASSDIITISGYALSSWKNSLRIWCLLPYWQRLRFPTGDEWLAYCVHFCSTPIRRHTS